MGIHHKTGDPIPFPSTVGLIRKRSISVEVTQNGFARTFEGETKYYRTQTITTAYSGMVKDNTPPTPDTSYTVTPGVTITEYPRGWSSTTTLSPSNTISSDLDGDMTTDVTPEEWDPPLSGSPTFAAPTVTETDTTYVETYAANGIWSGTKTYTIEWSNEIDKSTLVEAAENARDAASFEPDDYSVYTLGTDGGASSFIFDQDFGTVELQVSDYSLGTYTARPFISIIETLGYQINYGNTLFVQSGRTTNMETVVTLPSGFFFPELFRDDNQHIFGDWIRIDIHDQFPAEDIITGSIGMLGLSGHKFITESTGIVTDARGYCFLGKTFIDINAASGQLDTFVHSSGEYEEP